MPDSRYAISEAIRAAYRRHEDDEAMEPICLVDSVGQPIGRIRNGDYVIFYDIRGEREIELTQSFTDPDFSRFPTMRDFKTFWATMIEYDPKLNVHVAFPPIGSIEQTLAQVITESGKRVCKISETEKAIHVGYFMNGKRKEPFAGEERIGIESHKTDHMDDFPAMKAKEVANAAIERLMESEELIIVNFANIDVLGHIENEEAILTAVRTVDEQVGRVLTIARERNVTALITSDHGSAESWLYPEGTIDTGHTRSPVHFIYIDSGNSGKTELRSGGSLVDVTPTILHLFGLEKPAIMTGESLVSGKPSRAQRVILIITDGWGHNSESYGNLIAKAQTPVMDRIKSIYPHTVIKASGRAVGLPDGTVGNSEAGHMHIGTGRIIPSDRVRIQEAIEDGSFYRNEAFIWAMRGAKNSGTNLHLLGIISFFSSHGSIDYLIHLLRMAKKEGAQNVYIHGLLGRRGERPESGARYTRKIEEEAAELGVGRFVSIIGRHWALDREYNWDRIEKAYRWLVSGEGFHVAGDVADE